MVERVSFLCKWCGKTKVPTFQCGEYLAITGLPLWNCPGEHGNSCYSDAVRTLFSTSFKTAGTAHIYDVIVNDLLREDYKP